ELRQQREPGRALDLAHRSRDALRWAQPEQHVHVLGRHRDLEQSEPALLASALDQSAECTGVALLEHWPAPPRAPCDQVMELAAVYGLPPPQQLLPHFGSQRILHGRPPAGVPERMCT